MPGVDDRIVVNYDCAIASRVHIELNAFCAELDRALKRRDRVLRMSLVRAPVGDAFGWLAAAGSGQAFLSVVALCSMSAKDMSVTGQGQSALTAGGLERLPDEAP
jgi:hypothetical protein